MTMIPILRQVHRRGPFFEFTHSRLALQCIHPELAEARKRYYRENGIGYTARLPNRKVGQKARSRFGLVRKSRPVESTSDRDADPSSPQAMANKIGFERKGKLKKASNMNYGLAFSNRVEDELTRLTELEVQRRNCLSEEFDCRRR